MSFDPNETLATMRAASKRISERYAWVNAHEDEDPDYRALDERNADDREVIHDCAQSLDGWLSGGGLLPDAWQHGQFRHFRSETPGP